MSAVEFRRYAVFFVPPRGALADFGASWLGWDLETGRQCPRLRLPGLVHPVEDLTALPGRYGFHATLKAPMRLGPHATPEALCAATEALAREHLPVVMDGLTVGPMGRTVAVLAVGATRAMDALAAALVRGLDQFRAPATEAELARRRAGGLTPEQEAHLQRWGYPFVLDQFRFHMTLTGPLGPQAAATVTHVLRPVLQRAVPGQFRVEDVALCGEDAKGRFHLIERFTLGA